MRKLLIVLLSIVVLAAAGGLIASRHKYEVKKFVKKHELLYNLARKAVAVKARLFPADEIPLRDVVLDQDDWILAFDAAKPLDTYERFWGSIGFETFRTGLISSRSLQLFSYIKEVNTRIGKGDFSRQPFRYVRAHNLYSDGKPPWGEGLDIVQLDSNGRISYNWTLADMVFDRIRASGMKPIVEFGFMPDALASIPDRRQKWGRGNISPPSDYKKWYDLVHKTVEHFVDRYGKDEVSSWYFEVWNEPDLGYLFWIEDPDPDKKPFGDMKEYYKLYDHTAAAATSALPTIRIGGPASAGGAIEGLLDHVLLGDGTNGHSGRIDFMSSHAYGDVGFDYHQPMNQSVLSSIRWKLERSVEHDHSVVRSKARSIPFLLTEAGPRIEKKHDIYHKARYVAAWYAKMIDGMFWLGGELGNYYRPQEIVMWAAHQVTKDFDIDAEGIATSIREGKDQVVLKLPLFNAIEALGYLSNERISQVAGSSFGDAVHAIATRNRDQSVEIVVYHLDETASEKGSDAQDMNTFVNVNLRIGNLPFSRLKVYHYAIDDEHSNTWSLYEDFGSPKRIEPQERKELQGVQDLTMVEPVSLQEADNNTFRLSFQMQKNSVRLLRLLPAEADLVQ